MTQDDVVYGWLFFPRKQFPSSLSRLELAFQILALYACDSILNRLIYSALVVAVFLQWKSSIIRKRAYISPFQHQVMLLSFAELHMNLYLALSHFCTVFSIFLNLLRRAAGELAFSLVDMVTRQREKSTQPPQTFTGGSAEAHRLGPLLCKQTPQISQTTESTQTRHC
ncbi:hypothetical protein mRhiFer1_007883 [Rhinolophus ferrumequinum]|uniref:Uncharacterized protein n=1 Tax=Rhinolophus ferrumequinum TaxID=59479 RepID=A0A7J8AVK8_RHIFE|nr:hypothetical protein mRhiFer1_007883 [Rhinolophus ferrumequinum]